MRQRFAQLVLFLIPLTLLLGENPLLRLGALPVYWFELLGLVLLGLTWPEVKAKGITRIKQLPRELQWGIGLLIPALIISVMTAGIFQEVSSKPGSAMADS